LSPLAAAATSISRTFYLFAACFALPEQAARRARCLPELLDHVQCNRSSSAENALIQGPNRHFARRASGESVDIGAR
jgi:hypothetical protein